MSSVCITDTRLTNNSSTIKIATRPEEVKAALGLVYEAYLRSGLIQPNPHSMRVTPYHLSPTTEVLMATQDGQPACTVSLVRDGPRGLPMESLFDEEVAGRREQGIVCAEASCLADRREDHTRSFPLLARLMSFTIQCAEYRGIEQLLIAVHPRHSKFYQRFLGFQQITSEERAYGAVRDNPAVVLALDIPRLSLNSPAAYRRVFGKLFRKGDLRCRTVSEEFRNELRKIVDDTYYPEHDGIADRGLRETEPVCA